MIDIGTVLNKLSDTVDEFSNETKEFGLKVLVADGDVREMLCRKNAKLKSSSKQGGTHVKGKLNYNLQMKGALLLYDVEVKEFRSIKAACILQFKDFKSNDWLDVRH